MQEQKRLTSTTPKPGGPQPAPMTGKATPPGRKRRKRANLFTGSQTRNRHAANDASRMPVLPALEAANWLASQFSVALLVYLAALDAGVIVDDPDGTCRGRWTKPDDDTKPKEAGR